MLDKDEIKKMLKLFQSSHIDQISALKEDSETVLELSATLEKSIHRLESEKDQIDETILKYAEMLLRALDEIKTSRLEEIRVRSLTEINRRCWSLSIGRMINIIFEKDEQKQLNFLNQLLNLVKLSDDSSQQIGEATGAEQLVSSFKQFTDKSDAIQDEFLKA
ncbi:MAG: hypothetical protein J7K77_01445 [Dehalococcoidales bacterium]|nr:hypothetical protein [Dehalococcoidales bacterium]